MAAPATRRRLGHLPALDGLRAVAVFAVFLFHAGVVDGGFIGVDVFFVVSGFLITGLAITEIEDTGRLALGAFWARRARRLLPAVFVLCAAVVVVSAVLGGGVARRVGKDVTATLTYIANWARVGEGHDYFAAYESPSLLEHTWSLAVEEQFYVVWPLVLVLFAWIFGRRWVRTAIGVLAVAVGIGSVALAWWLARDGVALNRLYYGTDTRAVGLALGAAAACVLARGHATGLRRVGSVESSAAGVGAAALVIAAVVVDGSERWLYGPGFLLIAAAALVVVTASTGRGPVQRLLSFEPLVAIGRVSYGVYLWHWPVIVVLDHDRTGLSGPALGLLWVGVTALLTSVSWFLIEERSLPPALAHPRRTIGYVAVAFAIGVGASATVSAERAGRGEVALPAGASVASPSPEITSGAAGAQPLGRQAGMTDPDGAVRSSGVSGGLEPASSERDDTAVDRSVDPAADDVPTPVARLIPPADRPLRVQILGDSVAFSLRPDPAGPMTIDGFGDVEIRNDSVIACSVLRAGQWTYEGRPIADPDDCVGDDRFEDRVDAFAPDVLFLLFGWPATGAGRVLDDSTLIKPCQDAFDVAWADDYELLAHRFDDVTHVVVAGVPPFGASRPDVPADVADNASAGAACLNAELRRRDVTIFEFGDWICPDGNCATYHRLRPDGAHFDSADDVRLPVLGELVARALATAGYRPIS